MKQAPHSPPENHLPADFREDDLVQAIDDSGYPLQSLVAEQLLPDFAVTEEWGFPDVTTKESRSIDVYAWRSLTESAAEVDPSLTLILECKRSTNPIVFFQHGSGTVSQEQTAISGVQSTISVTDHSRRVSMSVPPDRILGLDRLPMLKPGPPRCASLSAAIRSGRKVQLSGRDLFNSIVLPLAGALDYAMRMNWPPNARPAPLVPSLIVPVAVLDAPMVLVESPRATATPVMAPWVRVVRPASARLGVDRVGHKWHTTDFVHRRYLQRFLAEHVAPFASEFATRALQQCAILRDGGEVSDSSWSWNEIKARIDRARA